MSSLRLVENKISDPERRKGGKACENSPQSGLSLVVNLDESMAVLVGSSVSLESDLVDCGRGVKVSADERNRIRGGDARVLWCTSCFSSEAERLKSDIGGCRAAGGGGGGWVSSKG